MSKGGGTQTTTQVQQLDPEVKKALSDLWQTGKDSLGNWVGEQAYRVAGFTPDQMAGMDQIRQMAMNARNYNYSPVGPGSVSASQLYSAPRASNAAAQQSGSNLSNFVRGSAQQLGANDFQQFMNPYIQGVIDPAVANMRRERDIGVANAGARAAAASSYGGSRGALEKAQIERGHAENVGQLVSRLMSEGYDRATATAMANAQMRQQMEMQNAQMANQVGMFNAGQGNQVGMFNAGQANQLGMFNAGQDNQLGMFNAGQGNQMGMFNAGQANNFNLQAADLMNRYGFQGANDAWNREMQAYNSLMMIGQLQQALAQRGLDVPIETLRLLAGLRPTDGDRTTTSTAPNNSPSPLQTILGTGLAIAGLPMAGGASLGGTALAALFGSDRGLKTNIEKLGKDPATGETMYAYDYKADVAAAKKDGAPMPPKRVGPMAQDIEKTQPERVRKVGGKRIVRGI